MSLAALRRDLGSKAGDAKLLEKIARPKAMKKQITSGNSLLEQIARVKSFALSKLSKYIGRYDCITDPEVFKAYIDKCVENKKVAIDTETTGLDPILDEIVGLCIYTPGLKAAYVPLNHLSAITNQRLQNQLSVDFVGTELERLNAAKVPIDFFNAKFDIRVMKNRLGFYCKHIAWDGFLGAMCINEQGDHGLKYLHGQCCGNPNEKTYDFNSLFQGVKFCYVPIDIATLYAGNDAFVTMELNDWQRERLLPDSPLCKELGYEGLSNLMLNVELPLIPTMVKVEEAGVSLNIDYCKQLSEKYHKLLDEAEAKVYKSLEPYMPQINEYIDKNPKGKLPRNFNIGSNDQLAIIIYDILGHKPVSKKKPRGTGEEILEKIEYDFCKDILAWRGVNKLITTYIDKMPKVLNPKTNRVHCSFNQYGTDTGRMSSSKPNLQNIPSHNTDIRPMFIASLDAMEEIENNQMTFIIHDMLPMLDGTQKDSCSLSVGDIIVGTSKEQIKINAVRTEGFTVYCNVECLAVYHHPKVRVGRKHLLLGSDYSQQEPKLLTHLCQDPEMIKAYNEGKDLYAIIGSLAFDKPYEQCLERWGPDGKERRGSAKIIVLGRRIDNHNWPLNKCPNIKRFILKTA